MRPTILSFAFSRQLIVVTVATVSAMIIALLMSLPASAQQQSAAEQQYEPSAAEQQYENPTQPPPFTSETITLTPTLGPAGTTVTVTGSGWEDFASRGWPVDIQTALVGDVPGVLDPLPTRVVAWPNASGTFSVPLTIPESALPGHEVKIMAILGNGGSVDAGFNVTQAPTTTPDEVTGDGETDLEVTEIAPLGPTICAGSDVTFRASIRNDGSRESGFFNIRWIADSTQTFDGGHFSIPAGATDTHDHIWKNLSAGEHTLEFIADFDDRIPESDENNNRVALTFTAEDCSKPDDEGGSLGGGKSSDPGTGGGSSQGKERKTGGSFGDLIKLLPWNPFKPPSDEGGSNVPGGSQKISEPQKQDQHDQQKDNLITRIVGLLSSIVAAMQGEPQKQPCGKNPKVSGHWYARIDKCLDTPMRGTSAKLSQHAPSVEDDGFSLAEIAVYNLSRTTPYQVPILEYKETRSVDAVEVGWVVWPSEYRDTKEPQPHLFVKPSRGKQEETGHCWYPDWGFKHPNWANEPWNTSIKAAMDDCGWYQVHKELMPNTKNNSALGADGKTHQYEIRYHNGNWEVKYQDKLIGWFWGEWWPERRFTDFKNVSWYGEVDSSQEKPCIDMGSGSKGTEPGTEPDAAVITDMRLTDSKGNQHEANAVKTVKNTGGIRETNPSFYNVVNSSTGNSFSYGGSGGC